MPLQGHEKILLTLNIKNGISNSFFIHVMHTLGVLYLDIPVFNHWRIPYYAEWVFEEGDLIQSAKYSLI